MVGRLEGGGCSTTTLTSNAVGMVNGVVVRDRMLYFWYFCVVRLETVYRLRSAV